MCVCVCVCVHARGVTVISTFVIIVIHISNNKINIFVISRAEVRE